MIESKLRRRALNLAERPDKKHNKPPHAGGRRRDRRERQRQERAEREAELHWNDTAALRELWRSYAAADTSDLDLHGAVLAVVDSPVESYRGVCGVVIEETRQTFRVLQHSKHKFTFVPKKGLVFALVFEEPSPTLAEPCLVLHGDDFLERGGARK